MDKRLDSAWWALRIGLGLVPLLAGLDKYFNLLANWEGYLNPLVLRIVPIGATAFMHLVGAIEILVGLAILTRFTRIGAYVAMAWLIAIALNLITTGRYLDIAVRDLTMAIGAYTLGRLSEVRESLAHRATNRQTSAAGLPHPARG